MLCKRLIQDIDIFSETLVWVRHFLANPDPRLTRPGAVCPWVPHALGLKSLFLKIVRPEKLEREEIKQILMACRDLFFQLEPRDSNSIFKSIILIFPTISKADVPDLIEGTQRELKPLFTCKGLMLGEFYPGHKDPGVSMRGSFRPLDSPFPMLVIRTMVEGDLIFLTKEHESLENRVRFVTDYLNCLEDKLPEKCVLAARQALVEAEAELKRSLVSEQMLPSDQLRKGPAKSNPPASADIFVWGEKKT